MDAQSAVSQRTENGAEETESKAPLRGCSESVLQASVVEKFEILSVF